MDPIHITGPKPIPVKALTNLTISAEKQVLVETTKKMLQKPYVANQVDEALLSQGVTLSYVAQKIKEQFEQTVIVEEPMLEPLTDELGEPVYEQVEVNGTVKLKPVLTPVIRTNPDTGKPTRLTKAVKKPDNKAVQFALNFWKEVLIATQKQDQAEAPKNDLSSIASIAAILAQNPDFMRQTKQNLGIDVEFTEIIT